MKSELRRDALELPCFSLVLHEPYHTAMELGLPARKLFSGTGLDEQVMEDPYTVIGRYQALSFYENLANLGPPGIGLDVGYSISMNERGSHGYLVAATDSLKSATQMARDYYDLFYQHVGWETRLEGNYLTHRFTQEYSLGDAREFCMDRVLTAMQRAAEYFTDGQLKPEKVTLDTPPPPYEARYDDIFQCPVLFSQNAVEIQYSSEMLDNKVSTYDPQVQEVMKSLCENLLERLHGRQSVAEEVRRTIHLINPGHFPSIEQVANRLGCAPRTLRRKLQQEHENFQKILDEERRSVACDHLQNSNLSIQQIAERCGFNSPQNFSHAFKTWTGLSPREFRETSDHCPGA